MTTTLVKKVNLAGPSPVILDFLDEPPLLLLYVFCRLNFFYHVNIYILVSDSHLLIELSQVRLADLNMVSLSQALHSFGQSHRSASLQFLGIHHGTELPMAEPGNLLVQNPHVLIQTVVSDVLEPSIGHGSLSDS